MAGVSRRSLAEILSVGLFFNEIVIVHIYGRTLVFNGVTIAPIGDLRWCTVDAPAVETEACTHFRYKNKSACVDGSYLQETRVATTQREGALILDCLT